MRQGPLLIGAAALALLGGAEVRRFESLAAKDIKSKLSGPNAKVSVRTVPHGLFGHLSGDLDRVTISAGHFTTPGLPLFTEPNRAKTGKARKVNIELSDFMLANLRIDSLDASIPDCRYDFGLAKHKGKIRLSQSGLGTGSVTILASDLERFVLGKFHEIKRVSIHLSNDHVDVEGYGEFLVVKANFAVDATLEAVQGTKLSLTNAHVSLNGQPAPDQASAALLQTLNPVVDLDKDLNLFGAIHIKKMSLENDRLVATGDTTIPNLPNLKMPS